MDAGKRFRQVAEHGPNPVVAAIDARNKNRWVDHPFDGWIDGLPWDVTGRVELTKCVPNQLEFSVDIDVGDHRPRMDGRSEVSGGSRPSRQRRSCLSESGPRSRHWGVSGCGPCGADKRRRGGLGAVRRRGGSKVFETGTGGPRLPRITRRVLRTAEARESERPLYAGPPLRFALGRAGRPPGARAERPAGPPGGRTRP